VFFRVERSKFNLGPESLDCVLGQNTVRVKFLAQEHNTVSLARARTRTAQSRDERTNHEATMPPTSLQQPHMSVPDLF